MKSRVFLLIVYRNLRVSLISNKIRLTLPFREGQ
jgi:hypothetical protein